MAAVVGPTQGVHVISSTWERDSHDLFDFEAQQLRTQSFTVTNTSTCCRSGADVQLLGGDAAAQQRPGSEALLRLVQRDRSFWVDKATPSGSNRKLWLVVRELASKAHPLADNDVIKLGRFKFRVRQLVGSDQKETQPELRLDDVGTICCAKTEEETASNCCRICLLEGSGPEDPLIAPCQCKGSIEYVHLGCLRYWIKGRLNLSDAQSGTYFYRPLSCELCKATYPAYVRSSQGDKTESLVEVPRTEPPFVVLENMVRDSQQHATRGLHVLSLARDKALKLGRGHESDVRIADVSISRCHAVIRYTNGQFLLEDNNSKFGTLVAMKKPRRLEPGSPLSIQMDRTLLSLSLVPDVNNPGANANGQQRQPPSSGNPVRDERTLRLHFLSQGNREDAAGSQDPTANLPTAREAV